MASELKLSGTTARVILQGNDSISSDQTFTFPDTGGEVATIPAGGSAVGYQQGTWTPAFSLSNGATGTSTTASPLSTPAKWVRVGNQVTISAWVELTSLGNLSGNPGITGAPYPADTGYYSGTVSYWLFKNNTISAGITITGQVAYIDPHVLLIRQITAANTSMGQPTYGTGVDVGTQLIFTITYCTDNTTWSPSNGAVVS